ncbi:MAG TPA: formylglycine-generating enzyme family protein [Verrucomicrobiales bacterium]|nr:formylglycine-generating enzyme family protein [Verrucomicrobiales bacterium]
MAELQRRSGKRRNPRIAAFLAGVGMLALLAVGDWMKGWQRSDGVSGASAAKEIVYDIGNGVKLTLCWCPAGSFLMGSPPGEAFRIENERQHAVTLSRGFWMAKAETTQEQWEAVMTGNPSAYKGERLPVDSVTWDEAKAFAAACTERLGSQGKLPAGCEFRLPTESQWEYTCRAGSPAAYSSGNDEAALGRAGWYAGNSVRKPSRWVGWLQSLPLIGGRITASAPGGEPKRVGEKEENAFGLQDMHGNVWEWCEDWYGEYGEGAVTDPVGPQVGEYRVVRGGSWDDVAAWCRSAYRDRWGPGGRGWAQGFRVCLVPGPAAEPLAGE